MSHSDNLRQIKSKSLFQPFCTSSFAFINYMALIVLLRSFSANVSQTTFWLS